MTTVRTYLPGFFPPSPALVKAAHMHKRGKVADGEFEAAVRADREAYIELQRHIGTHGYDDGQFVWDDHFRVLQGCVEGMALGDALVRWPHRNYFIIQPVVTGDLRWKEGSDLDPYFLTDSVPEPRRAVLPGISIAADVVDFSFYGERNLFMQAYGKLLVECVSDLQKRGYEEFLFHDFVGRVPEREEVDRVVGLYRRIKENGSPTLPKILLQTSFVDARRFLPQVLDGPFDVVSVDLSYTPLEALKGHDFDGLALGCVDIQTGMVETREEVRRVRNFALGRLRFEQLYLTTSAELLSLPPSMARQKALLLEGVNDGVFLKVLDDGR